MKATPSQACLTASHWSCPGPLPHVPRLGSGGVAHSSVGLVQSIQGLTVVVDFPVRPSTFLDALHVRYGTGDCQEKEHWIGDPSELQALEGRTGTGGCPNCICAALQRRRSFLEGRPDVAEYWGSGSSGVLA